MPMPRATAQALRDLGVEIAEDEPLAKKVYWRVGGPADGYASISSTRQLQDVVRVCTDTGCPLFVLGRGSNLLVADAGVRGLVITLGGELSDTDEDGGEPPLVKAGAGLMLTVLLARARKHHWTGLECFAGVPGTVGGAVVMNAGSRLGETVQALVDVDVVLPDGARQTLTASELSMSYRASQLPPGAVVACARLQTTGADPDESRRTVADFLAVRKATQPLHLPSCGSTFTNPPGDHAGRLIEAAGLKGFRIGDAQVSDKHANFVVNLGEATASDLRSVIEHVQQTVADELGVQLRREVHFAGDWP